MVPREPWLLPWEVQSQPGEAEGKHIPTAKESSPKDVASVTWPHRQEPPFSLFSPLVSHLRPVGFTTSGGPRDEPSRPVRLAFIIYY